jgi:hypothetical protein
MGRHTGRGGLGCPWWFLVLPPAALVAVSLFVPLPLVTVTTDTTAPLVPAGLTASAVSSSQINLAWTASTDNVSVRGHRIYRNGQHVATTVSTSYLDGGLAPATLYSYAVTAYDAAGNVSAQSAAASVATRSAAAYPLRMSANHRYFVDQNNVPFLVIGDSPQSLGTKLTPTDQTTYFADRHAKGFNAALIDLLCSSYTGGNADGKTYNGIAPFTSGTGPSNYDLSTPNENYFVLLDATINLAATYGIVVFVDPIETGSWLVTLQNNGSTKAFNYGVYVGNRYKSFPNIVWFHGNDFENYIVTSDNNLVGQVIDGIKSVDTNHLHSILLGRSDFRTNSDVYANLDSALSSKWGWDAAYTLSATPNVTLNAYNSSPTTPVVMAESNYEFENILRFPGGATGAYRLRAEEWGTLTWGGIGGYLYGNNYVWRSTWKGDIRNSWGRDIPRRLDTPGANQIANINTLMAAVGSWWNLVPDQTHAVVTAGYGNVPANNTDPAVATYCTTSANSSVSLTYCPKNTTLTVAMTNFSGAVIARWYDPSNGTFTAINGSPFSNTGTHNFAMPGNNADGNPDWVLLLQVAQPPHPRT